MTADAPAPVRLGPSDAGEVLTLQRAAYVTEARAHDDLSLPPLTEELPAVREELGRASVTAWGVRDDRGRLGDAVTTVALFTGEHSAGNLRLYRRAGYVETHRAGAGTYELVHLTKARTSGST
ncbi:GNAT family N-acetyltransferase [Pseudonocardia alni]|uniref:Acetyltransferase (GNAT) family protein n=1 Tax=Pseudonocardia alni TaxID=33907 RepID=A0AA44UPT0_PSEA5|nr:GNAT family N-acetyltransferase [Pseudonocardia alni]PKB31091.1 hypothetical protein ATL51_2772 [Pseudonocardia alni]